MQERAAMITKVGLLLIFAVAPLIADVSAAVDLEGARVKVYSYLGNKGKHHVVFKFGDLIQRAKEYQQAHPDERVELDFVVYKIARDVWTCVDRDLPSYGKVFGSSVPGEGNDKLIFKLLDAARAGVAVRFIYQNPDGDGRYTEPDTIGRYLSAQGRLPSNFGVHRCDWPDGATTGQNHNKFLLVNVYEGDGAPQRWTTYVATSNVDGFVAKASYPKGAAASWTQSGVLVNESEGLWRAYRGYFDILWENTTRFDRIDVTGQRAGRRRQQGFFEDVRAAHADQSLNWHSEGGHFEAYFYPLPSSPADDRVLLSPLAGPTGWDVEHNPVAKYVEELRDSPGKRYVKISMYHLKWGRFVERLTQRVNGLDELELKVVFAKDSAGGSQAAFNALRLGLCKIRKRSTHAKNFLFAFSGAGRYVTITGSANAKDDALMAKANNQLAIIETTPEHPIYEAHKQVFQASFD